MSEKKVPRLGIVQTLRDLSVQKKPFAKLCYRLLLPVAHFFDRVLFWRKLNIFLATLDPQASFQGFIAQVVEYFNVSVSNAECLLQKIPETGPLIIVSNHPTGFLETVLLPHLIMQYRKDIKVLANQMLTQLPGMEEGLVPINVYKREEVKRVLSTCTDWLQQGGLLLVFPSGEVADFKKEHGRVRDGEWSRLPVSLARKNSVPILNCHMNAYNTKLFHCVSRLCAPARVVLLIRELYKHSNQAYTCSVAQPLTTSAFSGSSDANIAYYLHALNECLPLAVSGEAAKSSAQSNTMEPVESHQLTEAILAEVERFTDNDLLYASKKIKVYVAKGSEIPKLLRYIQAVREVIFREVDMGSGRSRDADVRDETAMHVIVWETEKQQLVASSRCEVMSRSTPTSYLNDMYSINTEALFQQGDLFAVSRTFVASAYQKSFSSLLCLWRGMAQLVLRFETVRFLAGVVSISPSKMPARLFDFLSKYVHVSAKKYPLLAPIFSPNEPYQCVSAIPQPIQTCLESIETVAQLENFFSEISGATCQLPVLFRQYESIGTVPLSMSTDPEFSGCVDVLQVWDTHVTSEKTRLFFRDKGLETLRLRAKQRTGSQD